MSSESESNITQIIVAGDDLELREQLCQSLAKLNLPCPVGHAVSLDQVVDRVSRVKPETVILIAAENLDSTRRMLQSLDKLNLGRVLVVGPAHDARTVLELLQAGADAYVDRENLDEEFPSAVLRFRLKATAAASAQDPGRVIGVLGASGGCGASVVAANVAACLAKAHGEVALIDLRMAAADLSALLDLSPVHSLTEFCERLDRVDAEMFEQFLTRHACGIQMIAAPLGAARASGVTARGICRALAMACTRFPYVVVDMDNHLDDVQTEALWQMHQLLVVMRLDYVSIRNARRLLDHIKSLGVGNVPVKLVANRYRQPREVPLKQAEQALGRKIDQCLRDDPARMNKSVNKGNPVVLEYPNAWISRQLATLATSVDGRPAQASGLFNFTRNGVAAG